LPVRCRASSVSKLIVYEVFPCDVPLISSDAFDLPVELFDKPLGCILNKGDYVRGLTGVGKLAVVFLAGLVVIITEEMSGHHGDARPQEDLNFNESRRSPVSIAERMYPRQIEMRQRSAQDGKRNSVAWC